MEIIKLKTGISCYYNKRECGIIRIEVEQTEPYFAKLKRKILKIISY